MDYAGTGYFCRIPAPRAPDASGGIDFFGPQITSAGAVPLTSDELRFDIVVTGSRADILRVDWGDGTSWQQQLGRTRDFDVIHAYPKPGAYFFLATLKAATGYVAAEGVGPFHRPAPGPRTRYCGYESSGKGGTLTATLNLTCTQAHKLFTTYSRGTLTGWRCRQSLLRPWGSDTGVDTCAKGARVFVFTSNP